MSRSNNVGRHRLRAGLAGLACVVVTTAATTGVASVAGAASGSLDTVNIALVPALITNMPIWVAQEKGFFAKQGLQGNIITMTGGGTQALAALDSGSVDATYATVQQITLLNKQGNPIRMFVGNYTSLPYALVVQKSLSEPTAKTKYPQVMKDLAGKKIAISTVGSDSDLKLQALLKGAGMTEQDVQVVQGGTTPVPSFDAGQFDAILTIEPTVSQLTTGSDAAGRVVLDLRTGQGPASLKGTVYNGWVTTAAKATTTKMYKAGLAIKAAIQFMKQKKNLPYLEKLATKDLPGSTPAVLKAELSTASIDGFNPTVSVPDVNKTLAALDLDPPQTYSEIATGVAAGKSLKATTGGK